MNFIRMIIATLMVACMLSFATPAQASSTVCANDSRTLNYGVVHGRVNYRDCNNGHSRWVKIYSVKGSYNYHGAIGCSGWTPHLQYFKVTFHLNSDGGKSIDPWVKLPCKTSGHFSRTFNIDTLTGRTYPSHFAFGETFKAVIYRANDSTHNRYGRLG